MAAERTGDGASGDDDDGLAPFASRDVIWEGRPALGLLPGDLGSGLFAALGSFPALFCGLWLVFELEPARAAGLGALHAALLGAGVAVARAAGAGPALVAAAAFSLPVVVAAALASTRKSGIACAGTLAGLVALGLMWRFGQRRATTYQVTRTRVAVSERGRYTIVFARQGPPRLREHPFGDLADLEFPAAEALLTTRDGRTFRLPPQPRRLLRVRDAARLVEVLSAAPTPPRGG